MWLDWSFNQASHCWLFGTLESSDSTQSHCRKGGLTLVTAAGTAVPQQVPCAALCPCREAELDTVTSRAGRCQVLLWRFRAHLLALSLTSPSLRCPGWVNSPSTHRMTPLISVKATLSHNGIPLCAILPPITTPHFPEGIQWVTDLSSLSELTQHSKFCTIIQRTHRRQTDQLWMSITLCSILWYYSRAWAAIMCYPFLSLFSPTLPVKELISLPQKLKLPISNSNCLL